MTKKILIALILCNLCSCADPRSNREKIRDHILSKFAKQMQKENLYVAGTGGGCTSEGKIREIGITFDYLDFMTIEDARKLIVETTQSLICLVNANNSIQEHLAKHPEDINVLLISILGLISDEPSDYISSVSIVHGVIYYRKYNSDFSINPIHTFFQETFEEAVSILAQQSAHNPIISECQ